MSEHTHTTLIEGCYRCDLNRDEIRDALADTAEPDATERARAFAEACGYKWVGEMPYDRLPELFTSQLLAFLESETPRIKADAVRGFVEEIKNRYGNNDLGLFVYGCAKNLAKEMTEEV